MQIRSESDSLDAVLERLYDMDQVPDPDHKSLTAAEQSAVEQFEDTHQVLPSGRFSVKLPRINNPPTLGDSRPAAVRRFLQNERSLKKKDRLPEFEKVLNEYLELGHAEPVPASDLSKPASSSYYMPVHGVVKDTSTTTKLRAVFDASNKTSSGASFNDILLPGPNRYPLISTILSQFRLHQIAASADISKMFREVILHPEERDFHRFLLRNEKGAMVDCRMRRLTFEVTSSPYIATQVLLKLAELNQQTHPVAAKLIQTSFYVDDCLTGAATVEEMSKAREELCDLLARAGMTLRKWRSNSQELLSTIPEELREKSDLYIKDPLMSSKTLGVHWLVDTDKLHIVTPQPELSVKPSKRVIASSVARVYDVLGLISPATVVAKILLQKCWKLQIEWDTEIPSELAETWQKWSAEIATLSKHPIDRCLIPLKKPIRTLQIHGFADASTHAYGAALYLRVVYTDTETTVRLICSKARVTPVKATTIPRLELSAATLLAKLTQQVVKDLDIPIEHIFCWTDSTITLYWIRSSPSNLKTYVANRVASIHQVTSPQQWRHVRSKQNPADLASRGISPSELSNSSLWWYGPPWLRLPPSEWPVTKIDTQVKAPEELKEQKVCLICSTPKPWELFQKYSSFTSLTRIIAWIHRVISNLRRSKEVRELSIQLSAEEVSQAKIFLLRRSQEEVYPEVFDSVRKKRLLQSSHPLSRYDVYIDDDGLLQVTGRVRKSESPKKPKSYLPLSLSSTLTKLYLYTMHISLSHPGTSTMLAVLSESHYIPRLRNYLKYLSRTCVFCQKAYARTTHQQMGMLPTLRTEPAPPFDRTGVDFAGPFMVHRGNPRRPTRLKVYATLFVCFTTKAVHLELCSDLTSEAFLAAFHRFCARRGTPSHQTSDNGTNFIGAKREIAEVQEILNHPNTARSFSHLAATRGMKWHLSPPRAPHFGGLWEAGVRAMKTILRKLVSSLSLSYEELSTVLAEAEAILNSRPILPINTVEPGEELALTASHFLIGRPLIAPPPLKVDTTSKLPTLRR